MSAATKKRFGKSEAAKQPGKILDFSVVFTIDDDEVEHHFKARPQITYSDMVALKKHENDDQGGVLPYLDRMIRRCLLNNDGTPVKWRPVVKAGHFAAPDGTETPAVDLPKHTAHEAGSSRRRWVELIESDDAVVDFEQVMEVFEWLAGEAADRPTERPQRS